MTQLTGQHLHFDCASGAAGDMLLAAFLDLGVPLDVIGAALDAVDAPMSADDRVGRQRLEVARIVKHGIAAVSVHVATERAASHHHADDAHIHHAHIHHDHTHHDYPHYEHHVRPGQEHGHYPYGEIRKQIAAASITEGTRRRALEIFDRLARAEAKLHGTTIDRVAFHEVGAIDSIVDIVGAAAALDYLSPVSVTCASVAMGHGTLVSAHGVLPVPAPAALEVLRECSGVMVDGGVARELCTPTGAAILAATVTQWEAAPPGRTVAVGWGAGNMDLADRANVLRALVMSPARVIATPGEAAWRSTGVAAIDPPHDGVWQIDANLDDMSPELSSAAVDALFEAGALDVWWTPIVMKKGRPAVMLSAVAPDAQRNNVVAAMLRETTTIGVRYTKLERTVLARRTVRVETRFGVIAIKEALDGERVVNAAPEYESCAEAARRSGAPLKVVYTSALAAYDHAQHLRSSS